MARFSIKTIDDNQPEALVNTESERLLCSTENSSMLIVAFPFRQYWLPDEPVVQLISLYHMTKSSSGIEIRFTVLINSVDFTTWLNQTCCEPAQLLNHVEEQFSIPVFSVGEPLPLMTVDIAKPWGREIWYTGIEQRGVAGVGREGYQIPLPYILSALPSALCLGQNRSLILLKILDPLPEPVLGDLYFELHEEKREVYIVTAVDSAAWPDAVGEIRFGFCQNKRQQFSDDNSFRLAFSQSVKRYEHVRKQIDEVIDGFRLAESYECNEAVSADIQAAWMAAVPNNLQQQEKALRGDMESFTSRLPLQVADVVKVPCLTPHSLQHGVRTVEFQTPVYERLILSFAQKVLTQKYWDTDKAVELMTLDEGMQEPLELLSDLEGVLVERIVDFEDFEVRRIKLQANSVFQLDSPDSYALLMGVAGVVSIGDKKLESEQAFFLPFSWRSAELINCSAEQAAFLLAYPK